MLKRKIATATVVICLMGLARAATAQNSSDQFRPFNGLFADLFDDGSQPQQPQHQVQNNYNNNSAGTVQMHRVPTRAPRAASRRGPSASPPPPAASITTTRTLPAPPATSAPRPRSSATGNNYSFQYDDGTAPVSPALNPPSPSTVAGRRRGNIVPGPPGACRLAAARAAEDLPPVAVRRHGPDNAVPG